MRLTFLFGCNENLNYFYCPTLCARLKGIHLNEFLYVKELIYPVGLQSNLLANFFVVPRFN